MPLLSDYRAPTQAAPEDTKCGWLRETIQLGQSWLKSQRAYKSIREAKGLVLDGASDLLPAGLSRVSIPQTKRDIRELVSIFSNLRATASNKTDNEAYYDQANVLNKVDRWMWRRAKMDRRFRSAFQAAAITGTAYVSQIYDPDLLGYGKGGIRTDVYDADHVFLINPPADHNLQNCYAVVFQRRVPLHIIQKAYPLRAHDILPDHGVKAYTQQGIDYVQSFMSSPLKHLSGSFDEDVKLDDVFPTCDMFELYIMDLSINTTGSAVTMGDPGTSWEYTVPSFQSMIPTGTNSWEGIPNYKKATAEDARLYPLRRQMIATSRIMLYDGPSRWWHGKVPATKFSFDDWYSEALGFPLTRDTVSIEDDANELIRGISDMARVALDPPLNWDENLVSERAALKINPRLPGQRTRMNSQMGDAIKATLPAGYQNLPPFVADMPKWLLDKLDYVIGRADVLSIAKAKQVPSADSLEKIREMSGPLAQDMTLSVESAMCDLGDFRRWYYFQFMPKKQRMEILGENGIVEEDFDFDPGTLVPSHLSDEDPDLGPSRYTLVERARVHAGNFYYDVTAGSMARMTQMSQRLMLLQLQKIGFPIDPWTIAEYFEIDNFGPPPKGTKDIITRYIAWLHIQRELAQEAAGGQQQPQRGRPSTGNRPPQIKSKDGGTRSTVVTSR